jgi:hypothetical protein
MWRESYTCVLYIYYYVGTSSQWVAIAGGGSASGSFLPLAGGTLTGTLNVGTVTPTSTGYNVVSARNATGTSAVHGFAENSTIALTAAGQGVDAFDARMVFGGAQTYDHFVSYQARTQYNSGGTCTWGYGFWDGVTVGGPVTNYASYYAANPTGAGTISKCYGFYSEALNKGAVNYGFYVPYSSAGGHNAAYLGGISIGHSFNNYSAVGFNIEFVAGSLSYKYATSDFAEMLLFGNTGKIETFTANSGTVGNTISWNAGPYLANAGTNWTAASDARQKENVETIDVLARLGDYRAVSFDWIATGNHDIGVIAQELETSFPELVEKSDPARLGVNYDKLGAMALGGIRQLMDTIAALQAEVAALKAKLNGV